MLFLSHLVYVIYSVKYHLAHTTTFFFNAILVAIALASTLFLLQRILRPISILDQIFNELVVNNFKLSSANKKILNQLSTRFDEIGNLTRSFVKLEQQKEKHFTQLKNNIKRHERLENSLSIAHNIQNSLLPSSPGDLIHPNVNLYALLESAEKVGGDWYDFFFLDDQYLFFVLGDVSDKGIPAAIFMAIIKTHISSIIEFERDPAKLLQILNKKLLINNPRHMYVTLFIGTLNIVTGQLCYTNAGHCLPVLLQSNQKPILLEEFYQPIVGVIKDVTYQSRQITLNQYDTLFIYSDGVIEAQNRGKNMFSEKRLLDCLKLTQPKKVRTLVRLVYSEVKHFSNRNSPTDDISILAISLKRKVELTNQKIWLTLPASSQYLNDFLEFITKNLQKHRIITPRLSEITLAMEELLVNIIRYAYTDDNFGLISLGLEYVKPKKIVVQLEDYGKKFNPAIRLQEKSNAEQNKIGGYGLRLVSHLCSKIQYHRINHKNILLVEFLG